MLIQLKSADCDIKGMKFETDPQIFAKHLSKLPF